MKYTTVLLTAILLWTLPACTKDRNEKSELYFNGSKLVTRKVERSSLVGQTAIKISDEIGGKSFSLSFGFNISRFPTYGSYTLSYGGTDDTLVPIGMVMEGVQYLTDKHNQTKLDAYEYDRRGKYIINPTWLYDYYPDPTNSYYIKGNDSILVSGTIYEPIDITVR